MGLRKGPCCPPAVISTFSWPIGRPVLRISAAPSTAALSTASIPGHGGIAGVTGRAAVHLSRIWGAGAQSVPMVIPVRLVAAFIAGRW